MRPKLQLEIAYIKGNMMVRTVHVDDELRGKGTLARCDGFAVRSTGSPALLTNHLYTNGTGGHPDGLIVARVMSEDEYRKTRRKIIECLRKINGDPEGDCGDDGWEVVQ